MDGLREPWVDGGAARQGVGKAAASTRKRSKRNAEIHGGTAEAEVGMLRGIAEDIRDSIDYQWLMVD